MKWYINLWSGEIHKSCSRVKAYKYFKKEFKFLKLKNVISVAKYNKIYGAM
jgi:hypothetical protein